MAAAKKASKTRAGEAGKSVAKRERKAPASSQTRSAKRRGPSALAAYRSKRDFRKTPEPEGKTASRWKKDGNPIFVVQKHAASRLHYDFRLEIDGVLKSWAVPKGPSLDPAEKRLAVETEDHPIDYADFEGVIPQDEYGGGTVIVWDAGPFRNLKRGAKLKEMPLAECYVRGQIEVWLAGKKIRGGYALVHSKMGGNPKNWLLIKMRDAAASPRDPTSDGHSVISGRTLEEVAREAEEDARR